MRYRPSLDRRANDSLWKFRKCICMCWRWIQWIRIKSPSECDLSMLSIALKCWRIVLGSLSHVHNKTQSIVRSVTQIWPVSNRAGSLFELQGTLGWFVFWKLKVDALKKIYIYHLFFWGYPSSQTVRWNAQQIATGQWNKIIIQMISPNTCEYWVSRQWSQPRTMHHKNTKADIITLTVPGWLCWEMRIIEGYEKQLCSSLCAQYLWKWQ